jgi:hypothetical protein
MSPKDLDWTAITAPLSSHKAQLVLAAVASGVAVGSTILAFQSARQTQKLRDIKKSIRSRDEATAVRPLPIAVSLLRAQLTLSRFPCEAHGIRCAGDVLEVTDRVRCRTCLEGQAR